jgi:hypothetical protein
MGGGGIMPERNDVEQQRQPTPDEQKKMVQLLSTLAGGKDATLLHGLKDRDMEIVFRDLTFNDVKIPCLVIPLSELVQKEWAHINRNPQIGG